MIFEVLEGENVSFAMSDYYRRQLSDTMMLIILSLAIKKMFGCRIN